jgi:hypothetical protein
MRCSLKLLGLAMCFVSLVALAQDASNATAQGGAGSASRATVHIYRYKQFVGSALAPSVYCDGNQLARMENGRFFTVAFDPGHHTFTSNDKQSGIDLELKAGEEYFIRVELAAGFAKGHGRLILMSREQGSYEMNSDKLKPLDGDKIVDKTAVSVGNPHLESTALGEQKK